MDKQRLKISRHQMKNAELIKSMLERIDMISSINPSIPTSVLRNAKKVVRALDGYVTPLIASSGIRGGIALEWTHYRLYCEIHYERLRVFEYTPIEDGFVEKKKTFDRLHVSDAIAFLQEKVPKKRILSLEDTTRWLRTRFPTWTKAHFRGKWCTLQQCDLDNKWKWYMENSEVPLEDWDDIVGAEISTSDSYAKYEIQFGDPDATFWNAQLNSLDLYSIRRIVFGYCSGKGASEDLKLDQRDPERHVNEVKLEVDVDRIMELLVKYKLSGDRNVLDSIVELFPKKKEIQ
eukprot:TRINITY_DN2590_c0_g1_i2.p1 TRINITY_DN2590_c0_g1~~TRINITY_DN2590_c0_g1_i2.p1  ORF type:complete len:290 (+),score=20.87 TRINITY_DN2590_c0_g1_i2:826-1695(+)